jgi:hypothetical protein
MPMMQADTLLSTVEVAAHFGVSRWMVASLSDMGLLPPPRTFGRCAIWTMADLPAIEKALRQAGRLPRPRRRRNDRIGRLPRPRPIVVTEPETD